MYLNKNYTGFFSPATPAIKKVVAFEKQTYVELFFVNLFVFAFDIYFFDSTCTSGER
jgi:hypothetical protein